MVKSAKGKRSFDHERASFSGNTTATGIIMSILLAILMVVGEQLAEPLDTTLFGGTVVPIGIAVHMICNLTAVVTYGLAGSLIVANLNPMVSIATATGPMAPLWFVTNSAASFGARLVHFYWIRKDIRKMSLFETFLVALGGMSLNSLIMLPVQLFYFNLPLATVAWYKVVELLAGSILPALVAWKLGPLLKKVRFGE